MGDGGEPVSDEDTARQLEAGALAKCEAVLMLWHKTPGNLRTAAWWKKEKVLRKDAIEALMARRVSR